LELFIGVIYPVIGDILKLLMCRFRSHYFNQFKPVCNCVLDPSEMSDHWKLVEGFVTEEGKALLPHLSKTRSDVT